jgi:hypothetical protein
VKIIIYSAIIASHAAGSVLDVNIPTGMSIALLTNDDENIGSITTG